MLLLLDAEGDEAKDEDEAAASVEDDPVCAMVAVREIKQILGSFIYFLLVRINKNLFNFFFLNPVFFWGARENEKAFFLRLKKK